MPRHGLAVEFPPRNRQQGNSHGDEHPAEAGVPLGPGESRRGDAAVRSRRKENLDGALLLGLRRRRRIQRRARLAALLRPGNRYRHRVCGQSGRPAAGGFDSQGGVDQSQVKWVADDGVGRTARNGLNFTERGFGVRAALGCSDRGHSAASQLKPGEIDWDHIFGNLGARWFHTGGIFCALSDTTPQVALEAMRAARKYGVIVSYDLNYRESLWKAFGGKERAQEVNRKLA